MSKGNAPLPLILLVAVIAFSLGCSSGGNHTNPLLPDENQQSLNLSAGNQGDQEPESTGDNHYLLAYNMIYVDPTDPDNPTFEVVPVRATSIHLNILKLLEVGPCTNCFKITGCTKLAPLDFNINIEITHPVSGMLYTVFDTRSIIMLNGAHSFPASGLLLSDNTMGDTEFMDPDGYTALFNASTLGVAPGDFLGYFQGKIATPALPSATLNGYRRYNTDDPTNTRNALYNTDVVTQTIELKFGPNPFALGYAVDACWAVPISEPVDDPMTDFGPEANCEEPWKVVVTDLGPGLFQLCGDTTLQIDVYDWQGKSTHGNPVIECPDLFPGSNAASFVSDETGFTRYEVTLSNENNATVGEYKLLTSVEANENDPVGKPWLDLTAYQVTDISVASDEVNIPDLGLDSAIRTALGLGPSDPILRCDLNAITNLVAENLAISNLEGIQLCENLLGLSLGNNNITDITLLQTLSNLGGLWIFTNQISDLTPVENLTSLITLNFSTNQVSDLTPLQGLSNLTKLEFFNNQVVDLTPIGGLTNLTYLQIGSNNITDISPLAALVNLEYFGMSQCPVYNIPTVHNFTNLTSLDISSCFVSELDSIYGLNNLTELYAYTNDISYVSPLQGLTNLVYIDLYDNNIRDLYPLTLNPGLGAGDSLNVEFNPIDCDSLSTHIPFLQGNGVTVTFNDPEITFPDPGLDNAIRVALGIAPGDPIYQSALCSLTFFAANSAGIADLEGLQYCDNLVQLELVGNSITDISILWNLTHLTHLWLYDNQVADLAALQDLTTLTFLDVSINQIDDLTWLQGLPNMEQLYISGNDITDLTPIDGMTNLTHLYAATNMIADISPLQNLTSITNLELPNNQFADLTPLQNLTNLFDINLVNNLISDISPLTFNPGLGAGDFLSLEQNPLNCDAYGIDIPLLQGNGVNVTYSDYQVAFPDTDLDAVIRSALGLGPADPILKSALCTLTSLNGNNAGISNLEGIQYCENLNLLFLSNNFITDISQLQNLTNLTLLGLEANHITDIGPLQGLTNLTALVLADNEIVDISAVQYLVNLDGISLDSNIGIIDAEPLWICHQSGGLLAGADVYVNNTGLIPGDPWLDLLIAAGVNVWY